MECDDLPPGHAIPQAAADGGGQCRALVMGNVPGRRWRGMEGTKLQHFAVNHGGQGAARGDRLNHPRYRDFALIPVADFFQ
jgi:hypothetical protein